MHGQGPLIPAFISNILHWAFLNFTVFKKPGPDKAISWFPSVLAMKLSQLEMIHWIDKTWTQLRKQLKQELETIWIVFYLALKTPKPIQWILMAKLLFVVTEF